MRSARVGAASREPDDHTLRAVLQVLHPSIHQSSSHRPITIGRRRDTPRAHLGFFPCLPRFAAAHFSFYIAAGISACASTRRRWSNTSTRARASQFSYLNSFPFECLRPCCLHVTREFAPPHPLAPVIYDLCHAFVLTHLPHMASDTTFLIWQVRLLQIRRRLDGYAARLGRPRLTQM